MSLSKSISYYPQELIRALEINQAIQCDVHEFFHRFITELKASFTSSNHEDLSVRRLSFTIMCRRNWTPFLQDNVCFVVVVSTAEKCFTSRRSFPFWSSFCSQCYLQDCYVVNTPRLEDALLNLFANEKMVGSEQYFCSEYVYHS